MPSQQPCSCLQHYLPYGCVSSLAAAQAAGFHRGLQHPASPRHGVGGSSRQGLRRRSFTGPICLCCPQTRNKGGISCVCLLQFPFTADRCFACSHLALVDKSQMRVVAFRHLPRLKTVKSKFILLSLSLYHRAQLKGRGSSVTDL